MLDCIRTVMVRMISYDNCKKGSLSHTKVLLNLSEEQKGKCQTRSSALQMDRQSRSCSVRLRGEDSMALSLLPLNPLSSIQIEDRDRRGMKHSTIARSLQFQAIMSSRLGHRMQLARQTFIV
jgi:hypothetical protein